MAALARGFSRVRLVPLTKQGFKSLQLNHEGLYSGSVRSFSLWRKVMDPQDKEPVAEVGYKPIVMSPEGNKIVFECNSAGQLRMMLGACGINTSYWVYHLYNCIMYENTVIQGISLGGNPNYGILGLAVSALIVYTTRMFAHYNIRYGYISADGQRIGFQMHTVLGFPGRKIEAMPNNVNFEPDAKVRSGSVRLEVKGLDRYAILNTVGYYFDDAVLKKILSKQQIPPHLASTPEVTKRYIEQQAALHQLPSSEVAEATGDVTSDVPPPPPLYQSSSVPSTQPSAAVDQNQKPGRRYKGGRGKGRKSND